jgi:HlyD family secretion protein
MRKYFYAIGVIVFLGALFIVLKPKAVVVSTATLKIGPFEETLSEVGKVRSKDRKTVYAFASGTLSDFQGKVGDRVRQGQTLTTLDWDNKVPVKSPIDGVLTQIHRNSAGPVNRGEPIFEVSSLTDLEIVAEVLTPEAVRLSEKAEARVLNWGGEGEFKARISRISRAGAVKVSALGVEEERTEVRLEFEEAPSTLIEKFGDNYHVDLLFLISREEGVLTAPLGALFKKGDQWAVYKVEEGRARLQEIAISKRNDREALVTQGLSPGVEVILFPGDRIRDGIRVK